MWDSLAIWWPEDKAARAVARSISAKMHSGFQTMRQSMNHELLNLFMVQAFIAYEQSDKLAICKEYEFMASKVIVLLSNREIDKMRKAGHLAAELLNHLESMVKPGVSTLELNDEAERWTQAHGAKSAPLGYKGFPKSICTSVNEVVCHGIPNPKQILNEGDIINIDVTLIVDGYHGDTSKTFFVGTPSPSVKKLVEVTEECRQRGIAEVKPGARIGDIGAAIQEYAEAQGFSVVRNFVGHGISNIFHTAPEIPHYGTRGKGKVLRSGMVFTIEPMINEGTWEVEVLDDKWTAVTRDRKLSAQFEHTVVVTEDGVEILTLQDD